MRKRTRTIALGHSAVFDKNKNNTTVDKPTTELEVKSFAVSGSGHYRFANGFNSKR